MIFGLALFILVKLVRNVLAGDGDEHFYEEWGDIS